MSIERSRRHAAPHTHSSDPNQQGSAALQDAGSAALQRMLAAPDASASARPRAPGSSGVELCERAADIPVLKQTGVKHWWLRDGNLEVGMGKQGAGVPGQRGGSAWTLHTTLNDHAGQSADPQATCRPIEQVDARWANVDEACVRRNLVVGTPTGAWIPPINDCHEVVKDILDGCRIPGMPGAEVPSMGAEPVDAGVSP